MAYEYRDFYYLGVIPKVLKIKNDLPWVFLKTFYGIALLYSPLFSLIYIEKSMFYL